MTRVAAIQLNAVLADVPANLAACERLADEAAAAGARVIALPEFFTSGVGFSDALIDAILPADGAATELLTRLARRHDALVGGSFLCRDADGHVRNAYFLAGPEGILGRHDKDLPTMWEAAFYVEGDDDGVIAVPAAAGGPVEDDVQVGVAVCWELMRTQTVHRLRGRVDFAMTGSGWWSIPQWSPKPLFRALERRNAATAHAAAASFARFIGAPVIHAAHCGPLQCGMPGFGVGYTGRYEGNTLICGADGQLLAFRGAEEGEGFVIADVEFGAQPPSARPRANFWLHRRGAMPAVAWWWQRLLGPRWYRRHVAAPGAARVPGRGPGATTSPRRRSPAA